MKKIIVVAFVLLLSGCALWQPVAKPTKPAGNTNQPKACTQEAKLCPDGTSVGRVGQNCEFAECKGVKSVLSESQAKTIAEKVCIQSGESLNPGVYNENTKTWWFDANLNATQPGCNPACVVSEATQDVEINWRCTGLIPPSEDNTINDPNNKGIFITRSDFRVIYDKKVLLPASYGDNQFQLSVMETPGASNFDPDKVTVTAKTVDSEYATIINIFPRDTKLTEKENVAKINSFLYDGEKCDFIKNVETGKDVYQIVPSDDCRHNWVESGYIIFKDNNQYIVYYHLGQDPLPSHNFTIEAVK